MRENRESSGTSIAHSPRIDRCPLCGDPTPALTVKAAARFSGVTRKTIYRWISTGRIDHWRIPSGTIRIPLGSPLRVGALSVRTKMDALAPPKIEG